MKKIFLVVLALVCFAPLTQAQGYFINVHWHRGFADPTQAVVAFEANAYPQGECGTAPTDTGVFIKVALSALYSLEETCLRPDGTTLWHNVRDAESPASSTYNYCSEYLQPGTEHSAMIKTTHSPVRTNFPLCTSPNTLRLDSIMFNAITLYDITNPPFDSQFRAISDDVYVPPVANPGK